MSMVSSAHYRCNVLYERVMRYLVREGALVWDERLGSVPEVDLYRITTRGLKMLGAY